MGLEAILDRLPPALHSLQLAYRSHDFHHVPVRVEIDSAVCLSSVFMGLPPNSPVRSPLAEFLIVLYHQVDQRLRQAPLSRDGLPQLPGVEWRRSSPLAGIIEDIPPFGMLDLWIASLDHRTRLPRHLRQRPTRTPTPSPPTPGPVPVAGTTPSPIPPPSAIDSVIDVPGYVAISPGDWVGRGLDIAGAVLGAASLLADIVGAVLLGVIADIASIPVAIVSSLVALPLSWSEGDRRWAFNNKGWAFCQTIYDMSFQYQNEDLLRTPIDQWPPIRPAIEPEYPRGRSVQDEIARSALREGYNLAVNTVQRLEHNPLMRTFTAHGQTTTLAITGRRLLFFLNVLARRNHQRVLDYMRHMVESHSHRDLSLMRW